MEVRITLVLLLCEFRLHTEAIFFSASTSQNKTCRLGIMNPLPDFADLPKFTTFVDKTLLIEEFFKMSGPRQYHLITCPPKFGKTTNLNTIKRFLQYDEKNQKLFNDSSRNLKITQLIHSGNGMLKDHFQNQKCIYISFKNIGGETLEDTLIALRQRLSLTYIEFDRERKTAFDRSQAKIYRNAIAMNHIKNAEIRVKEEELVNGLSILLSVIAESYPSKNITILIDDYDDPIRYAIENNLDVISIYKLIKRIFSTLISTLHPNLLVRYALITGTLNVLEQTEYGHMRHSTFLDNHSFTKYFGFTASEVDHLLNNHFMESDAQSLVKKYYGRYLTRNSAAEIYNPYSIIKHLSCGDLNNTQPTFENYWLENTANQIPNFLKSITNNETFSAITSLLLTQKKITFVLTKYWKTDDLEELRKIMHNKSTKLTVRRVNLILSYLFHYGYLSHGDQPHTYCIPSEEIRTYLKQCSMSINSDKSIEVEQLKSMLSPPTLETYEGSGSYSIDQKSYELSVRVMHYNKILSNL